MTGKEKLLSKRILATLLTGTVLGVCNLMPVYAATVAEPGAVKAGLKMMNI